METRFGKHSAPTKYKGLIIPNARITPGRIDCLGYNEIFVFGSNESGYHTGGSAKAALHKFGAVYGKGEGMQGQSYAIPTTGSKPITGVYIYRFLMHAEKNPHLRFLVTEIGCGHAGHTPEEVAPMFQKAVYLQNVTLPRSFWRVLDNTEIL